jgi:predicted membrane protein DUF2207
MRSRLGLVLLTVLLLTPALAFAQNVNVEWTRWDAQIAVQSDNTLQIAETHEVHVLDGQVKQGTRFWTDPVQLQAVYLVRGNNQQPRALVQGRGGQPGTYTVSQSGPQTTLTYYLDSPANANDTFTVQINYTATSPTTGMVDWKIVPADHAFTVRSSTAHIQFPAGQAPDPSLVRVSSGNAKVSVNGNAIVIQSQGDIPAQTAFGIQAPYGAGVGAAGDAGNPGGAVNPVSPGDQGSNPNPGEVPPVSEPGSTSFQLPGLGTILLIVCVIGVLLLVGGGSLLRGLLGGVLGGGGSAGASGDPLGGQSGSSGSAQGGLNRGFRSSPDQNRPVGKVGNDKDSGGGASFG